MPQFNVAKGSKGNRRRESTEIVNILKQIRGASKFAQMKFKDLLDVSLLDNNSFVLRETRFSVRAIIEEVVSLMEAQAQA